MKTRIALSLIFIFFMLASVSYADYPNTDDTQGIVEEVRIMPSNNGYTRIRIMFSSFERDRWGCASNPGYVEISTSSSYVTPVSIIMMYDKAVTAKKDRSTLAIDSSSIDPCLNGTLM